MAKKTSKKKVKEVEIIPEVVVPTRIELLSIDYHSEGLNNMARKINEIIEEVNG